MSKKTSKKRIIIAAVLLAIFLVGAIVSVAVVLAAQNQSVETQINIAYIVDGVGAKVNATYSVVPIDEAEEINRVAMVAEGSEDLLFGVSQEDTTATLTPIGGNPTMDPMHQQIVFEYYFECTADAAFSIELVDSPAMDVNSGDLTYNMIETYYVSATRLNVSEYRDKITDETLNPQALTEFGSKLYIYISARIENENRKAHYEGNFIWELYKQDTINVNLNNGDTTSILKVIPNTIEGLESINMPSIVAPTKDGSAFAGYYLDDTIYIGVNGTGEHVADIAENSTLIAHWAEGMTIEGTTLTAVNDETALSEGVLNIPEGVKTIGDGTNTIETTATEVMIPNSVEEIAPNAFSGNTTLTTMMAIGGTQTAAYADGESASGSKLKIIGESSFANCETLTRIDIPATLEKIGELAFDGCSSLCEINLESIEAWCSLKFISENDEYYLHPFDYSWPEDGKYYLNGEEITELVIPEGVTKIPEYAFECASTITSIKIPSTLRKIESGAFDCCDSLSEMHLESLESWLNVNCDNGNPFSSSSGGSFFINGEEITELVIPDGTTEIPAFAFSNSTITSVSFPSSVINIGYHAFAYCENLTTMNLPSRLKSIGEAAFYASGLVSITIPSSVTIIGDAVFMSCESLTSVTFAENTQLTSIGRQAFQSCTSLTNITIPNSVTSIGHSTFYGCASLTSVIFIENSQLTSIGNYVFQSCTSLTNITIPNSVTSIENYAFNHCTSLTSITIPSSVTSIENYAFYNCKALTEINYNATRLTTALIESNDIFYNAGKNGDGITVNIGDSVKEIPAYLFYIRYSNYRPNITNVIFEENSQLTSIGNYAFYYCQTLTSITIPSSVTSIGNYAFYYCTGLTEINYNAKKLTTGLTDSNNIFCNAGSNGDGITVNIGASVKELPALLFGESTVYTANITNVVFDENTQLTSIGGRAFYFCSKLTSINIPNSVTSIGNYAFYYCRSLTSITIPSSVTSIGDHAFNSCSSLKSMTLPSSVTNIGWQTFYNCTSLTSITIPSSVTSIGNSAFSHCTALTEINYNAKKLTTALNAGSNIFNNAGTSGIGITVNIGSSVKELPSYLFYIQTSNNRPKIATMIFEENSQLTNIAERAFCYCSTITSITIPSSVTSIGDFAFYGCSSLTSTTIPAGVTSIGSRAFSGCTSLTNITIPAGVTSIGRYTFDDCSKLTSVTFKNTSGWKIYGSTSSTATGYEINVSTPATNATNLKNVSSGSLSATATNWGLFYLRRDS